MYGQLTDRPLGSTTAANGFIEYLPPSYSTISSKKLPIILFFHGSGENGNGTTDLYKLYNTGFPPLIKNGTWTYKEQFVVLMPQHTSTSQYNLCPSANEIKNFIDFAVANYNIDPYQVYITGLSCGANGVYDYIAANPTANDKVAAAVIISGNGTKVSKKAGCTVTIPMWSFHGNKDNTSPWANDVAANDFFKTCPTPHAEATLTLYDGVDHNAWDRTYDLSAGNDIYAWMLSYKSPVLKVDSKKKELSPIIYPNPVNHGLLNINSDYFRESPITKISLTDIAGKQIELPNQNDPNKQAIYQLDVSKLTSGLYILTLETNNGKIQEKVIIN